MSITPEQIKQLRAKTAAGFADCKKALEATDGNMDEAVLWLRKKGAANAAKLSDREMNEGIVAFAQCDDCVSMVGITCETDFVANNEDFGAFANEVAKTACKNHCTTIEQLNTSKTSDNVEISQALIETIAMIKENMTIKSLHTISKPAGSKVVSYLHRTRMNDVPDIGKPGCMLIYKGDNVEVAKKIAQHIVAKKTEYLSVEQISADFLAKERNLMREKMIAEGKPASMLDKILDGREQQLYDQLVLLRQEYTFESNKTVEQVCKENGLEIIDFCFMSL